MTAGVHVSTRRVPTGVERPLRLALETETPEAARALELALQLVRLRTGLVWADGADAGDPDGLLLLYGGDAWLRDRLATEPRSTLAVPRSPEGTTALLARRALDLSPPARARGGPTRLAHDLPALLEALVQPQGERRLTALARDDCQPALDLATPWADVATEVLAAAVLAAAPSGTQLVRIRPLGRARFGVALSHDIDYVETSFRYRSTRPYYLAYVGSRSPGRLPALARHFSRSMGAARVWRHERSLAVEEELGVESDWFVFARTPRNERGLHARAFNPRYRLDDAPVQALLRSIAGRGHVLGLHASPEAGAEPELLAGEREALERAAQAPVVAVRHHMGQLRWPDACAAGLRLGFEYDSSFIVNDAQGYRLGTGGVVPLRCGDRTLFELSPTWMDTVAFNYQGKDVPTIERELAELVERAALRSAVEGLVWHDIPMRRDGSEAYAYTRVLRGILEAGGLVAPCRTFVERARALLATRLQPGDARVLELPPELAEDEPVVVVPDGGEVPFALSISR